MGNLHHLRARKKSGSASGRREGPQFVLRLYTTGSTPRSTRALRNLRAICEALIKGRYKLEVIDIFQEPGRASEADIIAAPTLIKDEPQPPCRVVGDLSDRNKVITSLNLATGSE
ncbi:MAG TPA: circadian clock KaiB family protein [Candidatus Binataceae bacterium]|nr:circadian clock KaiB family protein [Candidatus Binataceae bacterium]